MHTYSYDDREWVIKLFFFVEDFVLFLGMNICCVFVGFMFCIDLRSMSTLDSSARHKFDECKDGNNSVSNRHRNKIVSTYFRLFFLWKFADFFDTSLSLDGYSRFPMFDANIERTAWTHAKFCRIFALCIFSYHIADFLALSLFTSSLPLHILRSIFHPFSLYLSPCSPSLAPVLCLSHLLHLLSYFSVPVYLLCFMLFFFALLHFFSIFSYLKASISSEPEIALWIHYFAFSTSVVYCNHHML